MKEIDYSDKAISMRITRMAQLRNLCVSLAKSGKAARDAEALREREQQTVRDRPVNSGE
ncbi:MAG: hypothetical protein M3P29_05220 [Acidobacteriota bacterium]|nr:hypothetical protein [Acidobacteriota bacterium]